MIGIHNTNRIKSINVVLEGLNFNSERYMDLMTVLICYAEGFLKYEEV